MKTTERETSRTAPTTMTAATCSGRDASVRSSSDMLVHLLRELVRRKRCDAPPARITAVTRRNEG